MMLLVMMFACGGESTSPAPTERAELHPLSLVRVSPSEITSMGGDRIVLSGTGFDEDSTAHVNESECTSLFVASTRELVCMAPAAETGQATIVVTRGADGAQAEGAIMVTDDLEEPGGSEPGELDTGESSLPDDSEENDTGDAVPEVLVEYCHIQSPCSMSAEPGQTSEEVYTWVYAPGVTDQVGSGMGIEVSLGVGTVDEDPMEDWVWSDCEYNVDKDGLAPGDIANDEFKGTFPTPDAPGLYRYASRVRLDGGPWRLCDLGGDGCPGTGSSDGFRVEEAGELSVNTP